jgi:hypothetical protein
MSGLANPGGLLGPGRRRPVGAVVRTLPYGQPTLEPLARDLAGKVKLVKMNVDTSPQISQRFAVQAIPTLLVLRHGQVAPSRRRRPGYPADLGRQCADRRLSVDAGCLPGVNAGGFGPLARRAAVPRVPSVLVLGSPRGLVAGRVAGANGISRDGPSARIERALRGNEFVTWGYRHAVMDDNHAALASCAARHGEAPASRHVESQPAERQAVRASGQPGPLRPD